MKFGTAYLLMPLRIDGFCENRCGESHAFSKVVNGTLPVFLYIFGLFKETKLAHEMSTRVYCVTVSLMNIGESGDVLYLGTHKEFLNFCNISLPVFPFFVRFERISEQQIST